MKLWPVAELVPHAGNMVLLDEVLSCDTEAIEVRLVVRPDGLLSDADGNLPAWTGIELMAQAIAAFAGIQARRAGLPVELGFLLGTRKYACNVEYFPAGSELRIRALCSLQDDNGMGVFECHLQGPGIQAEARLNVFRPPQPAVYLQEPQESQEQSHD
ncbi:3-hydroxylacyl-(acyl carrier protein) dehydratase [Ectopseudomonas mendocina]|uniref:3-hydroxylacyl-(Acyl carrier protein) dehydratase n=1 Tax=Ectopseudomonas mendocina TaxID=300 RepID=A0A379J0E6_ECTME|nr:hotdog family protein [Pseudomonas mendocina]MDF2076123.1 hotdog family protein [Pseudomonas mendocina]SUD36776.1 3-hydroxylacyl-(acyl carrier protein) dehydratase [Pseudomonas mendocina]SUD41915.1 3-hydroxylacyl-(acyl carrier protein) dehydratase [Pseudomonas mendocina]